MRPNWDETWMAVAQIIAQRSLCGRAKIGAVIVDQHDRIVAVGYNGPPAGFDHGTQQCHAWCNRMQDGPTAATLTSYEDCPSLHAEINALSVCDRSMREGGIIYVTGVICFTCAKAVANSGLTAVVMRDDGEAVYRAPGRTITFLERCGLDVQVVSAP